MGRLSATLTSQVVVAGNMVHRKSPRYRCEDVLKAVYVMRMSMLAASDRVTDIQDDLPLTRPGP